MARLVGLVVLLLGTTSGPLPAGAVAIHLAPNPLILETSVIHGTAELVGVTTGAPPGGIVLEGSVEAGDLSLLFRIRLDASSVRIAPVGLSVLEPDTFLRVRPTGGGWMPGPGKDVTRVSRTLAPMLGESLDFGFDGGLTGGEEGDLVFASYAAISVGHSVYVVVGVPQTGPFGRRDAFGGVIVPEPSTAAALALGTFGLAILRHPAARRRIGA